MTLEELNTLDKANLKSVLLQCCGSTTWVKMMMAYFPVDDLESLLGEAAEIWEECSEDDWKEAFSKHPKIGDTESMTKKFADTAHWAAGEQAAVNVAAKDTIAALAAGNRLYEEKFGYIFIVCATGKTATEMFAMLQARLSNEPANEINIAAAEQIKITKLRLQKLLS